MLKIQNLDQQICELERTQFEIASNGYASASIGMMPVKGNNGIEWQASPANLDSRVGTLEGKVSTLETNF